MANYYDQFPASPKAGDVITLSANNTYILPMPMFVAFEVYAPNGGKGGNILKVTDASGDSSTIAGGSGGSGAKASGRCRLSDSITVVRGISGSNAQQLYVPFWGPDDPSTAQYGGDATATTLSDARGVIASASGGKGGSGATWTAYGGSRTGSSGANGVASFGGFVENQVKSLSDGSSKIVITIISANQEPSTPGSITYGKPNAGKPLDVTLTPATDPEGEAITYTYERQVDSGAWTQVATSPYLTITDTVPTSGVRLRYRAKATDAQGGEGAYITGEYRDIDYNNIPIISGSDGALGEFAKDAPSWKYSVDDADAADVVMVTEALDGVILRSFTAVKGQEYTLTIPFDSWLRTVNGAHTLTITASDGKDAVTRFLTFTRANTRIHAGVGQATTTLPKACTLTLVPRPSTWPIDAVASVRVCNDAYADAPHWEDMDISLLNGPWYTFSNVAAEAGTYGLGVELTIEEGPSRRAVALEGLVMGVS